MKHVTTRTAPLKAGDVIRTHPREGFWGCAIVLADYPASESVEPRCHIAITPIVRHQPYQWEDLAAETLTVLEFLTYYRPSPDIRRSRVRTCITLYPNTKLPPLDVIANTEPGVVFAGPLSPKVGSGPGEYPLGSRVDPDFLGMEAVIAWRRVHDQAALEAEEADADAEYFAREEARLAKQREQDRNRRKRGS